MDLVYVTGNKVKFDIAVNVFKNTGINLIQKKIDTPEIQSISVQDVARYSVSWASEKLNQPVLVTDAGFYIEALNGFPGPFIKFVNDWLSADDFIKLMVGKSNRSIKIEDCLAYCQPGKEPIIFTGVYKGKLADKPVKKLELQ